MNVRVSFMYLNTARFMIRFVSSVKSAFPFTNTPKVPTGIKFKEQKVDFLFGLQSTFKKSVRRLRRQLHNYTLGLIQYYFETGRHLDYYNYVLKE